MSCYHPGDATDIPFCYSDYTDLPHWAHYWLHSCWPGRKVSLHLTGPMTPPHAQPGWVMERLGLTPAFCDRATALPLCSGGVWRQATDGGAGEAGGNMEWNSWHYCAMTCMWQFDAETRAEAVLLHCCWWLCWDGVYIWYRSGGILRAGMGWFHLTECMMLFWCGIYSCVLADAEARCRRLWWKFLGRHSVEPCILVTIVGGLLKLMVFWPCHRAGSDVWVLQWRIHWLCHTEIFSDDDLHYIVHYLEMHLGVLLVPFHWKSDGIVCSCWWRRCITVLFV